jgi:hypothetical protein
MQKALENPDQIQPYWNNKGKPELLDRKRFEENHKEYLSQNLGMMVGLTKVHAGLWCLICLHSLRHRIDKHTLLDGEMIVSTAAGGGVAYVRFSNLY